MTYTDEQIDALAAALVRLERAHEKARILSRRSGGLPIAVFPADRDFKVGICLGDRSRAQAVYVNGKETQ